MEVGKYWHWDAVNYRGRVDPVEFTLFEGKHTIKVKLREDGTQLDKLVLTNNIMTFLARDKKKTKTAKDVKKTAGNMVREKLQVPMAVESR